VQSKSNKKNVSKALDVYVSINVASMSVAELSCALCCTYL